MAEMTLEGLNELLAKAKISEFSRDKAYLIVLEDRYCSQNEMVELGKGMASLGVKCVVTVARGKDALNAFTLPDKFGKNTS